MRKVLKIAQEPISLQTPIGEEEAVSRGTVGPAPRAASALAPSAAIPAMADALSPLMPALPIDTSPEAYARQRDVYLHMGGSARLTVAFQLSDAVRRLTLAGIRRRHPGYSDEDVRFAWARLVLGDEVCRTVWADRPLVEP